MTRKITALLVFFALIPSFAAVRHLPTPREGLSNLHVNAVTQDRLGYIWVGTANGLCRNKGNGYDVYFYDKDDVNTIPSNNVTALFDYDGTLWIATARGVASKKENSSLFERYTLNDAVEQNESYYRGFVVYGDKLYTYGHLGLYEIDVENRKLIPRFNLEHSDIDAVVVDSLGCLWVASGAEIISLDKDLQVLRRTRMPAGDAVSTMLADGNKIMLGTQDGIKTLDPKTCTIQTLAGTESLHNMPVNTILPIPNTNSLLIGLRGQPPVLFRRDKGSLKIVDTSSIYDPLLSRDITTSFLDNHNNTWLGSFDNGLLMIPGHETPFNRDQDLVNHFNKRFVTRIAGDSHNRMWIGSRYNGLSMYDPATGKITEYTAPQYPWLSQFRTKFIQDLYVDSSDRLWMGIDDGLAVCRINPDGSVNNILVMPHMGNVVSMTEDADHNVWVGTSSNGIYLFRPDLTEVPIADTPLFSTSNITQIIPYDNEHVLVSSYLDNLYLINIKNFNATALNSKHQNKWNSAVEIFRTRDGNICIGTYDNGLLCYDPKTEQLRRFANFKSTDVLSIREDNQGYIWCSTSYGIYRVDLKNDNVTAYFKQSGIPGNQYHEKCSFTDADGNIYFGGNYGVQQIIPENIKDGDNNIPIYLTELMTLNREPAENDSLALTDLAFLKDLHLDHNNNALSIGFSGLSYDTPLEYAYMLDGFDQMWINSGQYNHAIYSNLPSGNYRFFVKVKVNDRWSEPEQLLNIHVADAPWLHPLAKIGYALIVVLLILMFSRLYIRLRLEKERLLLAEKKVQDERSLSQRKVNFFNNISHELRTPITLIYGPVKQLKANVKNMSTQEIEKSLEYIDKNVDRLLTLTTQILKFRTIQTESLPLQVSEYDPVQQIDNIIRIYNIYAAEKNISVNFVCQQQAIKAVYDSDKLEKIINNLLFNAVKYTPENGHITIRLDITDHPEAVAKDAPGRYMEIQIIDDGVGIPADEKSSLFTRFRRFFNPFSNRKEGGFGIGLNFVKHLVEKHHGVIVARANAVKGTTFIVDIPIDPAAYKEREWLSHTDTRHDEEIVNGEGEIVPTVISNDDVSPAKEPTQNAATDLPVDEETDELDEEDTGRRRVLIVEDKKDVSDFIASILSDDYDTLVAENGLVGLQLAKSELPDVIVTDVMMPLMDGFEFVEKLKNTPETSHIPVIMLTAKSTDKDKIKGYDLGADLYMEKPFNPDVLHSAINSIMSKLDRQQKTVVSTVGTSDPPPVTDDMAPLDRRFLEKLYAYINDNIGNSNLNVNLLGRELGFSRTNFYRKIKALTGVTPNDLLRVCRLNRAAQLILTREYNIGEIADMTGFGTQSHFSNLFKRHFGVSPRDYLASHTNEK